MAINFNVEPYYDDYNEDKKFYRILFKPGLSVQARELSQLQAILQKQIERNGRHFFNEGAKCVGGEYGYTDKFYAVKLSPTLGSVNIDDYVDQLLNIELVGEKSGVVAKVLTVVKATETDPTTLFVTYTSTASEKTSTVFQDNENLIAPNDIINGIVAGEPVAATASSGATATGASASIERGVYFVRGHFVLVDSQRIVLSKYTNTPSARIGLEISEEIVSADNDASLLDTAQNSPNFSARGADRYTITLTLSTRPLDSTDDADFIELERVVEGRQQPKAKTSEYSVLGDNLARRTYDESGNYIVKPYQFKLRETLNDGTNQGVYLPGVTTDSGNTPSDDLMTVQVSAGKSYVQGYEIKTTAPSYIDIAKPRTFDTVSGASTAVEVGNYVRINNLYGMPDIVGDGDIIDYKQISLHDTRTATPGQASGDKIGVARVRGVEFDSGDQSSSVDILGSDSIFKLYIFDIKMFTTVNLSGTAVSDQIPDGTLVRGVTSGAYGYVNSASTTTSLQLTSVVGTFKSGEQLTTTASYATNKRITNSGNTPLTVSSVEGFAFENVKQVFMDDPDGGQDFTADTELDSNLLVSGSVNVSGTTVTGFNSFFTSQLKVGDALLIPSDDDGALETRFISAITNDSVLTLSSAVSNNVNSVSITRARAFIEDQEKNILLRKLAKDFVKTLKTDANNNESRNSLEVRRQFIPAASSSGAVTLNAGSNETFNAKSNLDYQITVLVANGTASQGEIINIDSDEVSFSGTGTNTLTINCGALLGTGTVVKINATINKRLKNEKAKTEQKAAILKVLNKKNYTSGDGTIHYGTSAHHKEISLGVADAYQVLAVYDSGEVGTDATIPFLSVSNTVGTFERGEIVRGSDSGATGLLLDIVGPDHNIIPQSSIAFIAGEQIEGLSSEATATVTAYDSGSRNITDRFLLDTGQRDNYYDISKIVLKNNQSTPAGELLVVFDYFTHGTGDFFTVDSYPISYSLIPTYTATRIDPEIREPEGLYDLRSTVDFRPRVADVLTPAQLNGTNVVNEPTFDFESRTYEGGSSVNIPKDNSNFDYDYEHYLGRRDALFITAQGAFKVVSGNPSENPKQVKDIDNAMRIADIDMPPYLISIGSASVTKIPNKRFTMRDISLLENRINNIEYYTSLSLLEKSAETLQIKDANGLDRFKSGFLVDNFGGHKTGDVLNLDYRCAIDMTARTLRPKYKMKNIKLQEEALTDAQRTAAHYRLTNDIVTLPYTDVVSIEQPYATRIENLNPVLNFGWVGIMKLEPSSDEWFEIERLPDVTTNVEGNFDTIVAQNRNALGTIWNAPVTEWTGELINEVSTTRRERTFDNFVRGFGRRVLTRTVADEIGVQTRTGIETTIVEQIDITSQGDRVIATALVPFMRSNEIRFEARGMKPNTRVYPFFDKVNVDQYTVRTSGSIAPASGANIDQPLPTPVWNTIRRILVSYDKNSTTQQRITLGRSLRLTGPYGQIASVLNASTNTTDRDVLEFLFDENSDLEPNQFGELFLKFDIVDEEGRRLRDFQISEIQFFNENYDPNATEQENLDNALIRNINFAEVVRFENFETPENVVDGGAEIAGQLIDGINYRSDQTRISEARTRNARNASLTIRVRGGVRSVDLTTGVERFISNDDIEDVLVTDQSGFVSGIFTIPDPNIAGNPVFETGTRLFRLSSDPNNAENGVESFAQAEYTASGILETRQETFVATRNGRVETREVNESVEVTRVRDLGEVQTGWWDPLAQSIMPSTPGGEFITKIEVFFASKDDAVPVTCQLREMVNGLPTRNVLPFGSVTLFPDQVEVSGAATVPTAFVFDAPVYVRENQEICIVLMSDSLNYNVWISRMGETDVTESRFVSEQPYLGVLFKSQNNSTWTAYDYEDLKFKLYRAQFDTSQNGQLVLNNVDVPAKRLISNPVICTAGSNVLRILHEDHHMYDVKQDTTNQVTLSGVTSGIFASLASEMTSTDTSMTLTDVSGLPTSGTVTFRIVSANRGEISDEVVRGDINTSSGYVVENLTRGVQGTVAYHPEDAAVELYEVNGIRLDQVNKTHEIAFAGLDYYTIQITDSADEDALLGGNNVTATENALVDSYQLMIPNVQFPDTEIRTTIEFLTGTSASGGQVSFGELPAAETEIVDRVNYRFPRMIASKPNEDEHNNGNKSATVTFTLSSLSDNLSPVIDLERKSITTYANRLDNIVDETGVYPSENYVAPTAPDGDSGEAIYVTKRVQLQNPATSLKVLFDAVRNSTANIQVMYKVLRSDDSTDFDEIGWTYFNVDGSPDLAVAAVADRETYREYEYTEDNIPEFIAFSIKIKMNGTNSSEPPLLKDLRAIALAI